MSEMWTEEQGKKIRETWGTQRIPINPVDEIVSRLTLSRDAAYTAAESFKLANNREAEAQCFGEGLGFEKAIAIVKSAAC